MTMIDDRAGTAGGWPAGDDAMSALLAQNWWAIALRGVFAIIFGIIALLMPGAAMLALVLLFAAYLLVTAYSPSSPASGQHGAESAGDG